MKVKWIGIAIIWSLLLLGLSHESGYQIQGTGDMNLEIATMLTPRGLVYNLILDSNHYLKPYYQYPIEGRVSLSAQMGVLVLYLFVVITATLGLYLLKKELK